MVLLSRTAEWARTILPANSATEAFLKNIIAEEISGSDLVSLSDGISENSNVAWFWFENVDGMCVHLAVSFFGWGLRNILLR